jgi:hypothetical protein
MTTDTHTAAECPHDWCLAHQPCDCPYSQTVPHTRAGCRYARHEDEQEAADP